MVSTRTIAAAVALLALVQAANAQACISYERTHFQCNDKAGKCCQKGLECRGGTCEVPQAPTQGVSTLPATAPPPPQGASTLPGTATKPPTQGVSTLPASVPPPTQKPQAYGRKLL